MVQSPTSGIDLSGLLDANRYSVRRSPFFQGTQDAGCRRYDHINGYFTPVDYGHSHAEAYRAVRERVALYDTSAQVQIRVKGPDALRFSDYLLTRDLTGLEVGQARYGFLCRDDGVILTDSVVTRIADDEVWLSPSIADVILWTEAIAHHGGYDLDVREADYVSAHLHGAHSRDLLRKLTGDVIDELRFFRIMRASVGGVDVIIGRTVASPVLGYEVFAPRDPHDAMIVWNAILAGGVEYGLIVKGFDDPGDAMESGMLFFSYWITAEDNLIPLEFWQPFTDWNGEDFIGKRALEALHNSGGPKRRFAGLTGLSEELRPEGDKWLIRDGDRQIGFTRWVTHSHTLGKNIAYGLLDAEYADKTGKDVTVVHPGGEESMTITALPFIKPQRDS